MSAVPQTILSQQVIAPIDKEGLDALSAKGRADPKRVATLKCTTVCEGKFRMLNQIRTLAPHVIDEPPHLLGDDTAPNPSEAVLAALGSCIAVGLQANAVAQGIALTRLELTLEGDLNITSVWGTGDLDEQKTLGFTDIRVRCHVEGDAPREQLDALVAHADRWSPVANTMRNPVNLEVTPA